MVLKVHIICYILTLSYVYNVNQIEKKINTLEKKKKILEQKKYKKNKISEKYLQHINWCLKHGFIDNAKQWCKKGTESLKKTNDVEGLVKIIIQMQQFRIEKNNNDKNNNDNNNDNNAEI